MDQSKTTPIANVRAINRREVLGWLGAAGTVAALAPSRVLAAKSAPLRVLILGGTAFLGPALVEQALEAGHRVTLFNRGKTAPDLFKGVEQVETLLGDRNNQLETLQGREWDLVIDTSGYVPRHVQLVAELLAPHVAHYVFISSISVYASFAKPNDETSPVARLTDPAVEQITGETYGGLKALCEEAAEKAMPGRVTNIRPGLIVGPRDRTDRFTYWPARVAAGGEVLAPGSPKDDVQWIDVRDLAAFVLRTGEQRVAGVFNACSAPGQFSIGALLDSCRRVSGSDAKFTWADSAFLAGQQVAPWSDMPVWIPPEGEEIAASMNSTQRAKAAGLQIRAVDDTVLATLEWHRQRPEEQRAKLRSGLTAEREAAVLAAWHSKQEGPVPASAAKAPAEPPKRD
jgi:2'-hydroxyisoflavone reductase